MPLVVKSIIVSFADYAYIIDQFPPIKMQTTYKKIETTCRMGEKLVNRIPSQLKAVAEDYK